MFPLIFQLSGDNSIIYFISSFFFLFFFTKTMFGVLFIFFRLLWATITSFGYKNLNNSALVRFHSNFNMMKLSCQGKYCTFADVWYLNAKVIYCFAVRVSEDIPCILWVPSWSFCYRFCLLRRTKIHGKDHFTREGGHSLIWAIRGRAAGQSMVFLASLS